MRSAVKTALKVGVLALGLTGSMFATVIFSDSFPDSGPNAEPQGLGFTNGTMALTNWDVVAGSVDVLDQFIAVPCGSPSGKRCVDINGSSGTTGKITSKQQFSFLANHLYSLTLWVAGSTRNDPANSVRVSIGGLGSLDITLASSAPWQQITVGAFAGNGTTGKITLDSGFAGADGDNIGLLVDDIVLNDTPANVDTTPEPATLVLIGLGLAAIGLRRR